DVREAVESAFRLERGQPGRTQAIHNPSAAFVIGSPHPLDVVLAILDGGYRTDLTHGGRTHDDVLMHLVHRVVDGLRCTRIADAPTRHSVVLREAAEQDRSIVE